MTEQTDAAPAAAEPARARRPQTVDVVWLQPGHDEHALGALATLPRKAAEAAKRAGQARAPFDHERG